MNFEEILPRVSKFCFDDVETLADFPPHEGRAHESKETRMTVAAREASARVPVRAVAQLPVVVIGAGPVGLAAAAHLKERGLPVVVLEAGGARRCRDVAVGTHPHVHAVAVHRRRHRGEAAGADRVDPSAERQSPTGAEIVERYLVPLAAALGEAVRTGTRVLAVSREGLDRSRGVGREKHPFVVRVRRVDGVVEDLRACAVIDASGTWGKANPLGASGLPALGEEQAAAAGFVTGPLPDVLGTDRARFAGRTTLVVGMGHSAANTLVALAQLAREVRDPHRVGHPRHQRPPRPRRWHGRPAPRPRAPRLRPGRSRRHGSAAAPHGVLHPRAAPRGERRHGDSRGWHRGGGAGH